jgi:hypothetical protein
MHLDGVGHDMPPIPLMPIDASDHECPDDGVELIKVFPSSLA